ncbi:MAG: radical SAM family heme chaperone HemW, partial [Oceanobacter sp.]
SIGIQSLQDDLLKALGRIHGRDEALRAIEIAQAAGFDNLNLDLMHGLPGQSLEQAMDDLKTALAFKPSHLSWYQLTIEPNTEFYKETPQLPHEEVLWDIQEAGQEILAAEGMAHYEVSAYSRSGYQSRHNVNYWQFGDYIGIGAGAHGKLTQPDGQIVRTRKTRLPEHYLSRYHSASNNSSTNNSFVYRPGNLVPTFGNPYCAEETPIAKQDVGLECLMNALRLNAGILVSDFEKRTGLTLEEVRKPLNLAINKGLLSVDERLAPTELGRQYLNELLSIFLTD